MVEELITPAVWAGMVLISSLCGRWVVDMVLSRMGTRVSGASGPGAAGTSPEESAGAPHQGNQTGHAECSDKPANFQELINGGKVIGMIERLLVTAGVLGGMPALIGAVVAVKGLGRFADLRTGHNAAFAERFIVGTLTSLAWACGVGLLGKWLLTLVS